VRSHNLSNINKRVQLLSVILLFVILSTTHSLALDRAAYVGNSFLVPLQIDPEKEVGDRVFGIDLGYFFEENWALALSWDFGIEGVKRVGLGIGPQLFLFKDATIMPYLVGKFLYELDPQNDIGWRFNIGGEWNLVRVTNLDNLRFYIEIGASQLFSQTGPNPFMIELFRIGMSWNF